MRAIDPLERTFHKLQSMSYSAQQHILWRVAKGKFTEAMSGPWSEAFEKLKSNWDPKRDFAHGLLHAENLTRTPKPASEQEHSASLDTGGGADGVARGAAARGSLGHRTPPGSNPARLPNRTLP